MSTIAKFSTLELRQKKLKLVPGGPKSISLIEEVSPESTVYIDPENLLRLMPRDESRDLKSLITLEAETLSFNEGWVAYFQTRLLNGDRLISFKSTWQVPPPPSTIHEQTLYLFNGAQTTGSKYSIIQPVLRWATDEKTGESFWSVASYCVTSTSQAKHTPYVRVNPGQTLTGLIQFVRMERMNFVYSIEFLNVAGTRMLVRSAQEFVLLFDTLEIYDIQSCSDLPDTNKTEFINVEVRTKNGSQVQWTEKDATNACGLGCAKDVGGKLVVFY